jgi:RPA family protein
MHQVMNHSQQVLEEKVSVVHKLNNTIVKKVNNYERVNEMKDLGKREALSEYKKIVDEQANQHKKELSNLKTQYEYLLSEKEKEFEKFVGEFKVYHSQK